MIQDGEARQSWYSRRSSCSSGEYRMKFAAIDFETANHRSDSPCQVAVVIVDQGRRVEERSWLIRPKTLYFSDRCVAVHGILPRDVKDQPEWDHVWSELAPFLDGRILLAHNAMFDMAVLAATLSAYDLVCPRIEFQCTRLIARRCWPGRTGYGLKPTADALGISFQHHIAVEDARACADIALEAARISKADDMESLECQLSIQRGFIEYGIRTGPRCIRRSKTDGFERGSGRSKAKKCSAILQAKTILDGCAGIKPFENRRVFLSGKLLGLERSDAQTFLTQLGATVEPEFTPQVDYWIVGSPEDTSDQASSIQNDPSLNELEAQPSNSDGPTIVINQRQFLALIPGGLSAARSLSLAQ